MADAPIIRVVLVDDHPLVRSGTAAELTHAGDIAVVGSTGEGQAALSLVERLRPDVLLLDIHLPDLNGIEVARLVRTACPEVAIVVVTGYDDVGYARALLHLGVLGYLNKTATVDQIVAAVRAAARGQATLTAEAATAARGGLPTLTGREREVLRLLVAGRRNAEIATALGVSVNTVEFHVGKLYQKLDVRSRAEAIGRARELGLLAPDFGPRCP